MNILLIGKFFPIQGGEATKAYWLMKALSLYGHNVTILTDTSSYRKENLCSSNDSDKGYLKQFTIYNKINVNLSLVEYAREIIIKQKIDIIIGWYLFPFALSAIEVGNAMNIPVVIQHAGSDIHKLLNLKINEQIDVVNQLNKSSMVLFYPNTEKILVTLGLKNLVSHEPLIPKSYFMDKDENRNKIKENNGRYIVLGAKNKSKNYDVIKELSQKEKVYIDWFGVGEIYSSQYFNAYRPVAPWSIPELLRKYNGVIYSENNFKVATHLSRVPIEAIAGNNQLYMDNKTILNYSEYRDYINYGDLENNFLTLLSGRTGYLSNQENYDDDAWYEKIEYILMQLIKK